MKTKLGQIESTSIVNMSRYTLSIYKKFRAAHFDEPWKSENTIQLDEKLLKQLLGINFADNQYKYKEGNWPSTISLTNKSK